MVNETWSLTGCCEKCLDEETNKSNPQNVNSSFIRAAQFPPASAYIPICRMDYYFVFVFSLFTVKNVPPPPFPYTPPFNSTQPGGSLGATVQIRVRLATACNSLKFNVIFRSPMGTPFACRTAVTNRCNLFIMSPCYALVHGRFCSDGGWLLRTAAAVIAPVRGSETRVRQRFSVGDPRGSGGGSTHPAEASDTRQWLHIVGKKIAVQMWQESNKVTTRQDDFIFAFQQNS